jgi:O-antigen/teichoic acid export membrane protein
MARVRSSALTVSSSTKRTEPGENATHDGARPARAGLLGHASDPLFATSYLLLLASVGASAFGFVFWVVAARIYPPTIIGRAGVLISALTFVSGVTAGGTAQILIRFLPSVQAAPATLVRRVYIFNVVLATLAGFVAAKTAVIWAPTLGFLSRDPLWTLAFTAGSIVIAVFVLEDGALTGAGRAYVIPFENISYAILRLVLLAVGVASGLAGIFIAWSVPALGAVVVITVLLFRRILPAMKTTEDDQPSPPGVLRFGLVNWLGSALGITSATFMPILVLDAVGPPVSAAFYAAWTVAIGLTLISVSTGTSLTAQAAGRPERLPTIVRRALRQSVLLSFVGALVVVVAAPLIMGMFGPHYGSGVAPLRVLAVSTVPFAVSIVGLSVARVRESLRTILIWEGTLATLGLGLGTVLVIRYGIVGAAFAWLVAQCATALISVRLSILPTLRGAT